MMDLYYFFVSEFLAIASWVLAITLIVLSPREKVMRLL
jgi:hypothetical protein